VESDNAAIAMCCQRVANVLLTCWYQVESDNAAIASGYLSELYQVRMCSQ